MIKPKSQEDVVKNMLAVEAAMGDEIDEAMFPGLKDRFFPIPIGAKVQTLNIKYPNLDRLAYRSYDEIVDMLVNVLDMKAGVVGFDWTLGSDTIQLFYVDNFIQKEFQHEGEEEEFKKFLKMVLKSRKNLKQIRWRFDDDHILMVCSR